MSDVVAWWVGPRSGTAHRDATVRTSGSPGYGVFGTVDGRWVALGVLGEQRLWDASCRALGLDDLVGLDFAARLAGTDEVNDRIAVALGALTLDDALDRLAEHGAPATPVLAPEETAAHPQTAARGLLVDTAAGSAYRLPVRLAGGAAGAASVIPAVGEHADGFLANATDRRR
jgi:crotonobetainyl-CoA:carnitine CoA-transferase CaiB-like acyl-CoA transferase